MVDSIIVGRFVGEQALAAVGACYSLTTVFICIAIGGGIGCSVIVSRYFGASNFTKMKSAICTAFIAFIILSFFLAIVGLFANRPMLSLLNTPEDSLEMAIIYLRIYFIGLPFLFMYNVISAMFNSMGKSGFPLFFLIFSSILNVILDIFFVTKCNFGIAGVAYATLIAQGLSACFSFFVFIHQIKKFKSSYITFFDFSELFSMTRIAFPSVLQQSTVSIGMLLVQSVVNKFGSQSLAGYSAFSRIASIAIVPMVAINNSMSSYTAQNIGANKIDRVVSGYHCANILVGSFSVVLCILIESFHGQLIGIFLGEQGSKIAYNVGTFALRFEGFFYCFIGFKMAVDGLLRGASDMKVFTIANFVNLFIRVSVSILFAPRFGIQWVWYSVPMGWFANFAISYSEYKRGYWKKIYTSIS